MSVHISKIATELGQSKVLAKARNTSTSIADILRLRATPGAQAFRKRGVANGCNSSSFPKLQSQIRSADVIFRQQFESADDAEQVLRNTDLAFYRTQAQG